MLEYHGSGLLQNFDHPGVTKLSYQYNPARQLISRTTSSASYQISIPQPGRQAYVPNTLNQYSSVAGNPISYDTNGNLKSHDGWTYNYNGHNRLTSASKTGTALSLDYDVTGRLHSSTLNGSKITFLYYGDELVAEYNTSGTLLRRYVHGVGSDDPLVWFEGAGTTTPKYLLADERGSIVSETNASGSVVQTHQYGPYGEPINSSTSRFRYTGQILIPGTELYHYKARVYHPKLGRFLQTDPIGYKDGMNWYAYVGNDPINNIDPDGKLAVQVFATIAGGLIGGAAEYMSNPNATMDDIAIAAGAGAASGLATSIPGLGLGMTMLSGAGANGLAEAGKQLATSGSFNRDAVVKVATATVTGAIGGAAAKAIGGTAQIISGAKGLSNNTMTQAAHNMTASSSQRVLAGSATLATGVNSMKEAAVGASYGAGSNLGGAAGEKFTEELNKN